MKNAHNIITVNVGGKCFMTYPYNFQNAGRLRKEWDLNADSDGIFLDRDGKYFHIILNFLRTGKLFCPTKLYVLRHLRCEAKFYEIPSLVDIINKKIKAKFKTDVQKKESNLDSKRLRSLNKAKSAKSIHDSSRKSKEAIQKQMIDDEDVEEVENLVMSRQISKTFDFLLSQKLSQTKISHQDAASNLPRKPECAQSLYCNDTAEIRARSPSLYNSNREEQMNDVPTPPQSFAQAPLELTPFSLNEDF